jgi:hypothetical protein
MTDNIVKFRGRSAEPRTYTSIGEEGEASLGRTRVRNERTMHTFLFRSYHTIVESDEADLVRDVCFGVDKAQTKLKDPTTIEGCMRSPGAAAHRRRDQADRSDRCRSTIDLGRRMKRRRRSVRKRNRQRLTSHARRLKR